MREEEHRAVGHTRDDGVSESIRCFADQFMETSHAIDKFMVGEPTHLRVFLSHVQEESSVAVRLGFALEQDFHQVIKVFVSSNWQAVKPGSMWLTKLHHELERAAVVVVLLSPKSLYEPWLHFEVGAGWITNKLIIPGLLHGLKHTDLPVQFTGTQAVEFTGRRALAQLYQTPADALRCPVGPTPSDAALELVGESTNAGRAWRPTVITKGLGRDELAVTNPSAYASGRKQHIVFCDARNRVQEFSSEARCY